MHMQFALLITVIVYPVHIFPEVISFSVEKNTELKLRLQRSDLDKSIVDMVLFLKLCFLCFLS